MKRHGRWGGPVVVACIALLTGCGGGGDDATDAVAADTLAAPTSRGTSAAGGTPTPQSTNAPSGSSTNGDADGNPFNDTPASAGIPVAKKDCGITNLARDIITLLNIERARGASCGTRGIYQPAGSVAWNAQLEGAAIGHSNDMSDHNLFSHVGSGGQTLAVRVDATGYHWTLLGENIAAGFDTPTATVAAWMASDGHCANVMNPAFQDIALACVPGTAATYYRNYWTLNFGKPR